VADVGANLVEFATPDETVAAVAQRGNADAVLPTRTSVRAIVGDDSRSMMLRLSDDVQPLVAVNRPCSLCAQSDTEIEDTSSNDACHHLDERRRFAELC